jgi:hypothetical protein
VKPYAPNLLNSLADLQEQEAATWGRRASDAARWGLSDDHAEARRRAQSHRVEALALRAGIDAGA